MHFGRNFLLILVFGIFLTVLAHSGFSATTYWKNATWTGSTYNDWTNPTNGFTDNAVTTSAPFTGEEQDYGGYNFTEIVGKVINSVEILIDDISGDGNDYVEASWTCDNSTWAAYQGSTTAGDYFLDITTLGLGGCSNPITIPELDDSNFYVAIRHTAVGGKGTIYVDWIPVQVNYSLPVVGFTITLPGESPVDSEVAGNATTGIEFNTTTAYNYAVVPCVKSAGGNCQTSTVPIFNFTNVGNVALNYSVSINASLPSTISLYCDTDSNPDGNTTVTTSEWEVSASVAQNAWVDLWCWADFLGIDTSEDTQRRFYHNASTQ